MIITPNVVPWILKKKNSLEMVQVNKILFFGRCALKGQHDPWFCVTCSSSVFPFNCLNNKKCSSLLISQTGQTNSFSFGNNNSSLLLNPSPKITNPVNQLNDSACLCTMVEFWKKISLEMLQVNKILFFGRRALKNSPMSSTYRIGPAVYISE